MDIEKYRNINYEARNSCMICGKGVSQSTIDMPKFPLTEIYIDKKIEPGFGLADQHFYFCENCCHGQLLNVVDTELQYGDVSTYFFRTSQSISGRETVDFFISFLEKIAGDRSFNSVVELGCNDLYLLKSLKIRSNKLIGVDPILKNHADTEENITVIGDFFENVDLPDDIDMIICKDVLEHISQPKAFMEKIIAKASDNAIFFFQFPILETILEECRFDQVFHQHLNYFSINSLIYMLDEFGCGLIDYTINYNHWGAAIFAFQKGGDNSRFKDRTWPIERNDILDRYSSFCIDLEETSKRIRYFKNQKIYGYGAALMLPVLSYYLKDDLSTLQCVVDDDKKKDGLFYINLPVPIMHKSRIDDIDDSVVLLTAISSKINIKRILTNLIKLNPRHIIYPLRTI